LIELLVLFLTSYVDSIFAMIAWRFLGFGSSAFHAGR